MRALKMSKPDAVVLGGGFLMAILTGLNEPFFSLLVAEGFEVSNRTQCSLMYRIHCLHYFQLFGFFQVFMKVFFIQKVTDKARAITGLLAVTGFLRLLTVFFQVFLKITCAHMVLWVHVFNKKIDFSRYSTSSWPSLVKGSQDEQEDNYSRQC